MDKNLSEVLVNNIIKSKYNKESSNIKGIYIYGSRLYHHNNPNYKFGDYDYVVIVDMKDEHLHYESEDLDIHFLSEDYYKELLKNHDIMALECYSQNFDDIKFKHLDCNGHSSMENLVIKKYVCDFNLDLSLLRHSISSIVNNSWVKAKKKIKIKEEDNHIGFKSLYHSFRILDFGIQISKFGRIKDFNYLNPIRDTNKEMFIGDNWEYWKDKLKPSHNKLFSEFRLNCPKGN